MISKHELRARARKIRIDALILEKRLYTIEQCLQDSHTYVKGTCIVCQATEEQESE